MSFLDPVVDAVLGAASTVLTGLGTALTPALAIVVVTVILRAALLPLGASVVRAEGHRRRLAPRLAALQKRWAKNPERLQKETLALYADEKVSPFAGMLPALAQAPVLMVVYGVFTQPLIGGLANPLFDATLLGAPLGRHLSEIASTGLLSTDLVAVGLLIVIGVVAGLTRRSALRLSPAPVDGPAASLGRVLSWMPFLTVVFAGVVPLAATLYLAVSTTWTLVERAVLRRRVWPRLGVELPPAGRTAR